MLDTDFFYFMFSKNWFWKRACKSAECFLRWTGLEITWIDGAWFWLVGWLHGLGPQHAQSAKHGKQSAVNSDLVHDAHICSTFVSTEKSDSSKSILTLNRMNKTEVQLLSIQVECCIPKRCPLQRDSKKIFRYIPLTKSSVRSRMDVSRK